MFTFNEETKEVLESVSHQFRAVARNRVDFGKIDFPYMESMACLLHNLATMDAPFTEVEDYCKRIIEGANDGAKIHIRRLEEEAHSNE